MDSEPGECDDPNVGLQKNVPAPHMHHAPSINEPSLSKIKPTVYSRSAFEEPMTHSKDRLNHLINKGYDDCLASSYTSKKGGMVERLKRLDEEEKLKNKNWL